MNSDASAAEPIGRSLAPGLRVDWTFGFMTLLLWPEDRVVLPIDSGTGSQAGAVWRNLRKPANDRSTRSRLAPAGRIRNKTGGYFAKTCCAFYLRSCPSARCGAQIFNAVGGGARWAPSRAKANGVDRPRYMRRRRAG